MTRGVIITATALRECVKGDAYSRNGVWGSPFTPSRIHS